MKYIKLFESMNEKEVEVICRKYDIRGWKLRPDGLVDVDGYVDMYRVGITELPLRFGVVSGDFSCLFNQLTTLKGSPTEVGGNFDCGRNYLTTLEGAPTEVRGAFYCQSNYLTTLKGGPKKVGSDFNCYGNNLTTLEGAPTEVPGSFYCGTNKFTTLKGAPQEVGGNFHCDFSNLTTLEGGPTEVGGSFYCFDNYLTTLKGAPEYVGGEVDFLPNRKLPAEFLEFLRLNNDRGYLQEYILKWQKDFAVWRRDGSFNKANFIQMMEDAQDELK